MPELQNSEIIKQVLVSLLDISSRKTNKGHAVFTMSEIVKKFKNKYDFLKNVEIKDTRFIELDEPISVMTDINTIDVSKISKALYDIIKNMNLSLGKDAGHFFIKELRNNLGSDYYTTMQEIGVDLGLMQLEFEVNEMSKKLSK